MTTLWVTITSQKEAPLLFQNSGEAGKLRQYEGITTPDLPLQPALIHLARFVSGSRFAYLVRIAKRGSSPNVFGSGIPPFPYYNLRRHEH
jgi:hypothetical protein